MTSNIWFSSDLHFGHTNILKKFCPTTRQGETADEMDQIIVDNINRQVKKGDTMYWLGDIFFYNDPLKAHAIMDQLPVRPKLIPGNHDDLIFNHQSLLMRFDVVGDHFRGTIGKRFVHMYHFPIFEWDRMWRGSFHLYGHVHSRFGEPAHPLLTGRAMDVGIDSRPNKDMTMWNWDEIEAILSKRSVRTESFNSEIETTKRSSV